MTKILFFMLLLSLLLVNATGCSGDNVYKYQDLLRPRFDFQWGQFMGWIELLAKLGISVIIWAIAAGIPIWIFRLLVNSQVRAGRIKQRTLLVYETLPLGIITAFLWFSSFGASPLKQSLGWMTRNLGLENWFQFVIRPIDTIGLFLMRHGFQFSFIKSNLAGVLTFEHSFVYFIVAITLSAGFALVFRLLIIGSTESEHVSRVSTVFASGWVLAIASAIGIFFYYNQPYVGVIPYLLTAISLLIYPLMAFIYSTEQS